MRFRRALDAGTGRRVLKGALEPLLPLPRVARPLGIAARQRVRRCVPLAVPGGSVRRRVLDALRPLLHRRRRRVRGSLPVGTDGGVACGVVTVGDGAVNTGMRRVGGGGAVLVGIRGIVAV